MTEKPNWMPECPWSERAFPMTDDEYVAAVPDPKLRTAISGFLMREGWRLAERDIFEALYNHLDMDLMSEE